MAEVPKGEVFVIQPIGEEGSPVRKRADAIANYIVAPVVREFDLKVPVGRADRDPTPGPITSRLLRSILDAQLIVADLTGRNPNVFYELCFAHSFGKPVVILVDKAENLPFDVKNERVIALGNGHGEGVIGIDEAEETKRKLREALKVTLNPEYVPASLVTEVASVQNIESMTPDNPIASELATVRRRVEQIFAHVSAQSPTQRPSSDPTYKRADLLVLMEYIETLAGQGSIQVEQVGDLITMETSERFDDWVRNVVETYFEDDSSGQSNFEDIPF